MKSQCSHSSRTLQLSQQQYYRHPPCHILHRHQHSSKHNLPATPFYTRLAEHLLHQQSIHERPSLQFRQHGLAILRFLERRTNQEPRKQRPHNIRACQKCHAISTPIFSLPPIHSGPATPNNPQHPHLHNTTHHTQLTPLPLTGRPRPLRPLCSLYRLPPNNRFLRHNIRPTHACARPRIPPPLSAPQRPHPRHRFRLRLPNRRSSRPHRPPSPRRRHRSHPRSRRSRNFKHAEKRTGAGMAKERAGEICQGGWEVGV